MDITLAIVLFITIFSFLSWLTTPITVIPQSTIGSKPIERQLKEVFETIDEQETKSVVSVTDFQEPAIVETSPTKKQDAKTKRKKIKPIPEQIDFSQIKLQKARQIAKAVGITQSVKGKPKPKELLLRQLKQKIKNNNIPEIEKIVCNILAS